MTLPIPNSSCEEHRRIPSPLEPSTAGSERMPTLAIDNPTIIGCLQELQRNLRKEKQEGRSIPQAWIEKCGFDPHELVNSQVICMPDLQQCNLRGDVHALLEYRHWIDVDFQMYEFLRPSLLLATRFLTDAVDSRFWMTMFFGERSRARGDGNSQHVERVQATYDFTEGRLRSIQENLLCIGQHDKINYCFSPNVRDAYAETWFRPRRQELTDLSDKVLVVIAHDFWITALRNIDTQHHDQGQKLRFNL